MELTRSLRTWAEKRERIREDITERLRVAAELGRLERESSVLARSIVDTTADLNAAISKSKRATEAHRVAAANYAQEVRVLEEHAAAADADAAEITRLERVVIDNQAMVQLIDTANGRVLWSERIGRKLLSAAILKKVPVAVLAYDGLCTFEFGIAVELFGLTGEEIGQGEKADDTEDHQRDRDPAGAGSEPVDPGGRQREAEAGSADAGKGAGHSNACESERTDGGRK